MNNVLTLIKVFVNEMVCSRRPRYLVNGSSLLCPYPASNLTHGSSSGRIRRRARRLGGASTPWSRKECSSYCPCLLSSLLTFLSKPSSFVFGSPQACFWSQLTPRACLPPRASCPIGNGNLLVVALLWACRSKDLAEGSNYSCCTSNGDFLGIKGLSRSLSLLWSIDS